MEKETGTKKYANREAPIKGTVQHASTYDEDVVSVVPLISAIAYKKLGPNNREDAKDIIQKVSFKLWKWLKKRGDDEPVENTSLSKIAATATQNEIRTHFRTNQSQNHYPIDDDVTDRPGIVVEDRSANSMIEGNTRAEYYSLIRLLWVSMQELSLRQRVSLLFFEKAFLIDIVVAGCCSLDKLAEFFELSPAEFEVIIKKLPMSDEELTVLLNNRYGVSTSKRQMWNARGKAKAKLRRLVSE